MSVAAPKNPFCLEPVKLQAQFFGRETKTQNILSLLHHGQCVSVVGPAKIGKTSLLFHVAHPHIRARRRLAEDRIFVYLDGYSLANLEEGECYLYIREEAIRQIKGEVEIDRDVGTQLEELVRRAGSQTAYFGLRTLLQGARDMGLKLTIALDHLDALNQNFRLEQIFFSALRSLHTSYAIAYLAASQSSIDKLERICPYGPGSPFFNIFQQISIGLLTEEASRRLVATLLDLAGARFPKSVINCILDLGQCEPHRLQRAGYIAFEIWQGNHRTLRKEHCEEIRQRVEEMGI